MKKTLLIALITLLTVFSVTAENLKIKIEGPERSYNQMRIVNNTSKSDFDCKVYSLKQKDEKFIIQGTLGVFYLKETGDSDSCSMDLKKNSYIGIALPEDFGKCSYSINYQDLPFFDIVEITINDGENPEGQEF